MSKHTPGNWGAFDMGHGTVFIQKLPSLESPVSTIALVEGLMKDEENLANARLIAAAPDGLEAAKVAYVSILLLPPVQRLDFQDVLCKLRDFIAKATGADFEDVQNEYEARAITKGQQS